MGVDISSKLMLSIENPQEVIEKHFDTHYGAYWQLHTSFPEAIEELGLEYASPYYDSYPEDWIVGIEIPSVILTDMSNRPEWNNQLFLAKRKLTDLFGDDIVLTLQSAAHVT